MSARSGHNRNASASASVHNKSVHNEHNSSFTGGAKRHLPVNDRENVFNEWGAVIKHQDEIDRELRRQQEQKLRERQKNYKMQLDLQYQEYMDKKKGALSEQARKEENILKTYEKDIESKRRMEDEKRNQLVTEQKTAAFQSINEMSTMKKEVQSIREMERQLYYNKLKQQEEMENQRKLEEKEKSRIEKENYSRILALQHKSKLDKMQSDKIADKYHSEAQRIQLNRQEEDRNKFFSKLNNIQIANDMKQKKLQEYMEQDPKELRSKKDEHNYIKNLEVVEKKNLLKDHESKFKKQHDQVSNYMSLAQQLQERNLQKETLMAQENAIANHYMKEADKFRQENEEERLKKQRLKEEYYKDLSNQINVNKKKKQYSVLMSEHERRVNDKDIKAYEYNDTTNLYAKVPGFGGDNRLDRYTDQSLKLNKSAHNSPARNISKNSNLDVSLEHGSNLAKMGQMSLGRSTNILTDAEEPPRIIGDNYNPLKLERVRENMEKEDAFKYRANTNNRGYGFEQNINKSVPADKMVHRQDEANSYDYNFVAPGNY